MLGAGLYGVLRAEATLARKTIGDATEVPPDATGWYGRGRPGPALRIALLGDSSAAGYGVDGVDGTPGAQLGSAVAARANRRVHLGEYAMVGARSSDLGVQVDRALPTGPDVAVILIGANDVTHRVLPSQSVRYLEEAVRRLCAVDIEVVVGTCPDLGTIRPIAPPLKQIARTWSRRLAAAQTINVVEAGGRTVSLGSLLGAEFLAAPAVLFGPDRFHPSADGYRKMSSAMVPSILAALGFAPDNEAETISLRGEAVLPVSRAAVEAARTPGTEVDGTEVGGAQRGVRGRWVALRHRRRGTQEHPESPSEDEQLPPAEPESLAETS